MTFSNNMVHILSGYPMQSPDDPDVALLAFYLSFPHGLSNSAVVNKDVLKDIVKIEKSTIGGTIGGTIVSVDPLPSTTKQLEMSTIGGTIGGTIVSVDTLPSTTKQLEDKNESDRNDDLSNPNPIIIFASLGGVSFVVVIAALLLGCKRINRYSGHRFSCSILNVNSPYTPLIKC